MELDHVGVAVTDLAAALARWVPRLGTSASPPELVPSNRVRVAFLEAGGAHVELIEPTAPDSPVAKFLAARGEGVHHLAFRVPSVDAALAELAARGDRVVDRTARPGARGRRVGFAHPSAFGGVLVEYVEGP
ncbi:MAG TPA: methylmalonyl-CoA epimerase [Thermoplasmata archaeon]|jgi:methylmalonyl-CoA epimerase|nr:methylmalonyl-CoA epimerase [Thermoplasmata archaeon]